MVNQENGQNAGHRRGGYGGRSHSRLVPGSQRAWGAEAGRAEAEAAAEARAATIGSAP